VSGPGDAAAYRAAGALYGLAVGDALGMPTQSLPRAQIVARHGTLLEGFEPAPPGHPLAAGMPAGSVTDDTEQALLLAGLLIDGLGRVDPAELARGGPVGDQARTRLRAVRGGVGAVPRRPLRPVVSRCRHWPGAGTR
jgi:ADP-ribosylglycohydrolase